MKIDAQWLQFMAFLPKWKITLLSVIIPFIVFLLYYFFICIDYQQETTRQQVEVAQTLTRINYYQNTLGTMPPLNSLITQQTDYDTPLNNQSANERLQHLLITYHFTPETWENMPNSLYKLTFTLPYPRFLALLKYINQTGLSLVSLNISPIKTDKLSVQISLTELNNPLSEQGDIS